MVLTQGSALIVAARNLMRSPNYFEALLGVAIVTGRRMIELAKTGSFEQTSCTYAVLFHGQAKKKYAEFGADTPYVIPVLAPTSDVIQCVERIRQLRCFDDIDNDDVHRRIGVQANCAAKKLFSNKSLLELHAVPTFHNARMIYGHLTFYKFNHSMSINLWLKTVLGHDGLETSLNYSSCSVNAEGY
ncbi:unnamed protein product, partial [Phaeothamnion confervicola]